MQAISCLVQFLETKWEVHLTLVLSTDGDIVTNSVSISDAPAVEIAGNGISFTNAAGATLSTTSTVLPVIRMTGIGTTVINQLGARIEATAGYLDSIWGSSGSDTIDNFGVINGWVRLGDGADSFTEHRSTAAPIAASSVDLGAGNDTYTLINFTGQNLLPSVDGGTGDDTLILSGPISIAAWYNFLGFEHLFAGKDVTNLDGFSGLISLTLEAGGFNNFVRSVNATLAVALNGNSFGIGPGSSFGAITGSANSDSVTLSTNSADPVSSVGAINMGGGDDFVNIFVFDAASPIPVFKGAVDGGQGARDTVQVTTRSNAAVDLSAFSGFELLTVSGQTSGPSVAHVINASGFLAVSAGGYGESIAIGQSSLAGARVTSGFFATLTIEATTTFAQYGYERGSFYNPLDIATIATADPTRNLSVFNRGTILGTVDLNLGDDLYDGSLGVTGGTIFGYAGNDTLIGGAGAERIEGGFGNDTITGNGGINSLYGDAGNDRLVVNAAGSGSSVDGGADFDTLAISGAVSLGGITSIEAIELTAGSNLTLTTSQLMAGLAPNTQLSGSGTITVQLEANVFTAMTGFQGPSTINFVLNGSAGDDYIKASHFNNTINGGTGRDFIRGGNGVDTIDGGADNDKITGWGGADILTGGSGNDQFRYFYATDSGVGAAADKITDFTIGSDVIDLRLLDKDLVTPDIQNYTLSFVGSAAFSSGGAGQIRFANSGADMLVQFDLDGNGTSDMEIVLQGLAGQTLSVNDFLFGTTPGSGSEPQPSLAASEPATLPAPEMASALAPSGAALVSIDTLYASPVSVIPIEMFNDPMALPGHELDLGLTQHADLLHMI
ncbi:MAG: hypothetical protein ACKOQM_07995 [Novosphingobium sp.]